MTQHRTLRPPRIAAALLVTLLALTGCTSSSDQSASRASVADKVKVAPSGGTYVALGDSFTSAPLVPVTDVASGCFRSSANYPTLLAAKLGLKLDDRSCGGAVTADFTKSQYPGVPPQFSALSEKTDVVTVGIGGNDNRLFRQLVGKCPAVGGPEATGTPCTDLMTSGGGDRLSRAITKAHPKIVTAIREIQRRAPEAKVLVVGYPQMITPDSTCAELPLAKGDYPYAAKINKALTDSLQRAATKTGATYIDVFAASKGHDICSADPWVNGAVNDQKRAARYHPFAAEQVAVAKLVEGALARG
ncbi:MAG: SGNH/GDSL hydrolase family protein [Marmoricola sp.]